jgi:hypothetical protein
VFTLGSLSKITEAVHTFVQLFSRLSLCIILTKNESDNKLGVFSQTHLVTLSVMHDVPEFFEREKKRAKQTWCAVRVTRMGDFFKL